MEKWDIMDESGRLTGKQTVRGAAVLGSGEYHLVVHIWIMSSDGRLLIQRRSKRKKFMPGEWAATGGAAVAGETSLSAARRELYEELGIRTAKSSFEFITRFKRKNSFVDLWAVKCDLPIKKLRLQRSEVAAAKWISVDELKQMLSAKKYHNYGEDYFSEVFKFINKEMENGNK